jgi:hypothetical protein
MENMIDERYRLDLIKYHLDEVEEKSGKTIFFCPLCQFNRPNDKYTQKKGAMFWCDQWNAWRFNSSVPWSGVTRGDQPRRSRG